MCKISIISKNYCKKWWLVSLQAKGQQSEHGVMVLYFNNNLHCYNNCHLEHFI